jgi:hypothetical protein
VVGVQLGRLFIRALGPEHAMSRYDTQEPKNNSIQACSTYMMLASLAAPLNTWHRRSAASCTFSRSLARPALLPCTFIHARHQALYHAQHQAKGCPSCKFL